MLFAFVSISLGSSSIFFFLAAVIFILLSFLFYRFTIPPLPTIKKIALSLLRSAALTLLLLVIFEPILSFINIQKKNPSVAVLIDNTQSLEVSEKSADKLSNLKKYLETGEIEKLGSTDIDYYFFDSDLRYIEKFSSDSVKFSGEITDISASFGKLKDKLKTENHQAVVLISDGNYNVGKNPIYEAENLGVPIYTIGIGDTVEQKDVLVTKVVTNYIAYAETRVPVDVTVRWSGFNNENTELVLSEGANVIERKMITLAAGTNENKIRFYYEPKEEGMKKLTTAVSKMPGELTDKNNYKSIFVKVLKSKLQGLIIAGSPSPDVSIIRQTLSEDEHIKVDALVQKSQNEFYGKKYTPGQIDSADCLLFIGFPNIISSSEILNKILSSIEQQKKPVFFISGKDVDYSKLQILEPYLPFNWTGINKTELNIFASVSEKMSNHPLVNLTDAISTDAEGVGLESWSKLPPIYKTQTQFRAKPESDILANIRLQTIALNEPLIMTRNITRQKSFAITGYGLWRWRLLTQGNPQTDRFLHLFLTNAVRWLTTKEDEKQVKVNPTKENYTTVDAVEFTGQVYDEQYRPINNAEVRIEIYSEKEKSELVLNSIGNGRYEGRITGLQEGDFSYNAKANLNGRAIGEDKGKFSVGKINIEYLDTKMNKQILEQIAYRSGGKYLDLEKIEDLTGSIAALKLTPQEITNIKEIEIWNWEYIAAIIIFLLSIEWFIRKRSGMV